MAKQLPKEVEQLIRTYQNAQQKLIDIIIKKNANGTMIEYQTALLAQVNEELDRLNRYATDWTEINIPKYYTQGMIETGERLARMGVAVGMDNAFSQLHHYAIKAVTYNAFEDLIDAHNYVGRHVRDNVRKAGLDAISQKLTVGETVKQTKKNLIESLSQQGITAIKKSDGKEIRLDAYAELVARSTSREATNRGTLNRLTENGYDLVKMSSHPTTCPVCAALQGRVYSISGNDKRFPPLSSAHRGQYANVHPNCRHVLMPYVERFNDVEKDMTFSNRPFKLNKEDEKKLDSYNKIQAEKRKLRADRLLWEKYNMKLPDDTPKTLSGFRRMKNAESPKWKNLKAKYNGNELNDNGKNGNIRRLRDISKRDFKTYTRVDDVPEWAKAFPTKLDEDEKFGIRRYTGQSYQKMNNYLRGHVEHVDEEYKQLITSVKSALNKGVAQEDIMLYRGHNIEGVKEFERLKNLDVEHWKDEIIEDKGFTSTSIIKNSHMRGKKVQLTIHVPKGYKGFGYVRDVSQFVQEDEVILQAGKKFRILNATAEYVPSSNPNTKIVNQYFLDVILEE
jgi:hypothetical protein